MPDQNDYENAGKRLLLGLHRAGQTLAHGGGKIIDLMTFGQLGAAEGIDEFTEQVGMAYAELDALPEDSPEARVIKAERAAQLATERQQAKRDAADQAESAAVFEQLRNPLAVVDETPRAGASERPAGRVGAPPRPPQSGTVAEKRDAENVSAQLDKISRGLT